MYTEGSKVNNFVIGFPRCGTSFLRKQIRSNHPEAIPTIDELQYFHKDEPDYGEYEAFFSNVEVGVDISPTYILDTLALERLKKYNPYAKIVVVVREPEERDISAYNYVQARGRLNNDPATNAWIGCGAGYATYIRKLYELFPERQVYLIIYDDLIEHPTQTLKNILSFFKLAHHDIVVDRSRINASVEPRMYLLRILLKYSRPVMRFAFPVFWNYLRNSQNLRAIFFKEKKTIKRNATKNQLYSQQIQYIENITGRRLDNWHDHYQN